MRMYGRLGAARRVRRAAAAGRRRARGHLVARRAAGAAGHRRARRLRRPADHRQLDRRGPARRAAHPRRGLRARRHRPGLDPQHVVAGDPRLQRWTRSPGAAASRSWSRAAGSRATRATPTAQLLAGWLTSRCGCPIDVEEGTRKPGRERGGLRRPPARPERGGADPGRPPRRRGHHPAVPARTPPWPCPTAALGDLLSEELRRLDPDEPYSDALEAATGVTGLADRSPGARARVVRPAPTADAERQRATPTAGEASAPRRAARRPATARELARERASSRRRRRARRRPAWPGRPPRRWSPGWPPPRPCTGRRRWCSPAAGSASPSSSRSPRWPPSPSRETVDWTAVDVWWGDERFVPADDDERNEKRARRALLDRVGVPDRPGARHAAVRRRRSPSPRTPPPGTPGSSPRPRRTAQAVPRLDLLLLGHGPRGARGVDLPRLPGGSRRAAGGRRPRLPQAAADAGQPRASRRSTPPRRSGCWSRAGQGRGGGRGAGRRGAGSSCRPPACTARGRPAGCWTPTPRRAARLTDPPRGPALTGVHPSGRPGGALLSVTAPARSAGALRVTVQRRARPSHARRSPARASSGRGHAAARGPAAAGHGRHAASGRSATRPRRRRSRAAASARGRSRGTTSRGARPRSEYWDYRTASWQRPSARSRPPSGRVSDGGQAPRRWCSRVSASSSRASPSASLRRSRT